MKRLSLFFLFVFFPPPLPNTKEKTHSFFSSSDFGIGNLQKKPAVQRGDRSEGTSLESVCIFCHRGVSPTLESLLLPSLQGLPRRTSRLAPHHVGFE